MLRLFKIYNLLNISIFTPPGKILGLLRCLLFFPSVSILHSMKVKRSIISLIFLFAVGFANAQVPVTASTIAMGGNTENGIWVSVGQLFAQQTAQNGYEVAAGVSQAQVVDSTYAEEGCKNQDYDGHGFHLSAPLALGEHTADMYVVGGQKHHYDLRKHLILNIFQTYDTSVYITYHGVLPDGIQQGMNNLELHSVKGCDSVVHLYADLCPYTVMDIDENSYNTVVLSNFCWTQSNLMSTHYSNNSNISRALVYNSLLHPNVTNNLATYGRLYTWFSAVGTEEGSSTSPTTDEHGFVQGICPTGWHIPTLLEANALNVYQAIDLRSTNLWVNAAENTNSTEFTALPAGKFNAVSQRFEGLGSETNWWTVAPCGTATDGAETLCTSSLQVPYFCDTPTNVVPYPGDAYSVRCVKNHEQIDN